MRAETVSVGTEILLGQITDTNAVELGKVFAQCGIVHTHRQTVGDNLERLREALELALSRADIVVTIGGLGPTVDDLTRDGIAAALDEPLSEDPALVERLQSIFASRRLTWTEAQTRQAMRPDGSDVLPNPNGTAVGLVCRKNGKTVIAMPGPRAEFVPMLQNEVAPLLAQLGGGETIVSKTFRVVGMGESMIEEKLSDLMSSSDPTVAPYAKTGEVHLRLTTRATDPGTGHIKLAPLESEIRSRLGQVVYGVDDESLEQAVVALLKSQGVTVGTAESCTGGWLGQRLTSVPGSSDVYVGGVVSYSNEVKRDLLSVSAGTLDTHGAVSQECAREMAEGCRKLLKTDYAVSITGVAGPGGGTAEKPVGLVYIGLAGPQKTVVERFSFPGTRDTVRLRSTQSALMLLRLALLD